MSWQSACCWPAVQKQQQLSLGRSILINLITLISVTLKQALSSHKSWMKYMDNFSKNPFITAMITQKVQKVLRHILFLFKNTFLL